MPHELHYFQQRWIEPTDRVLEADVVVYGGTAAGVVTAVTAAEAGYSAVLLNPARHLGGMTSGGLGWTDFGNKGAIGGRSRRFYQEMGAHYGHDENWTFEPHVAEQTLERWIKEAGVPVHHAQFLEEAQLDDEGRIEQVRMIGRLRATTGD